MSATVSDQVQDQQGLAVAKPQQAAFMAPLFLSHGSPTLPIDDVPARSFLRELGKSLPRPKAIVIMSPHWETRGLSISAPGPLATIHDFGGFPEALYQIIYPVKAPEALVAKVEGLFIKAGFSAQRDSSWGIDHGAWVPLREMYPEADIPVVEVSLPMAAGPRDLVRMGEALAPLASEGVLIVGSGGTVHNLRRLDWRGGAPSTAAPDWAKAFDAWLDKGLTSRDLDTLSDLADAPSFRLAHPREEHLLPVFFALGAAGPEGRAELLHRSYTFGSLSMTYYRFAPEAVAA